MNCLIYNPLLRNLNKKLFLIFVVLLLFFSCKTPLGTKFTSEKVDTSDWTFYKYLNPGLKLSISIYSGIDLYLSSISYEELKISKKIISFYKQIRNKSEILLFGNTYDTIDKKDNLSILYHKNEKDERLYTESLQKYVSSEIERKPLNENTIIQNFIIDDYFFYEIIHHRTENNDFIRIQYFSKKNGTYPDTETTKLERGILTMYNKSKLNI